jgi:hypothetical protein
VALGKALKINNTTISKWRDDVAFAEWLNEFVGQAFHRRFNMILLRAFHLAMRGSIKHMEFFAKYSGEVDLARVRAAGGAGDEDEPGAQLPIINIIVPRPPGALPAAGA